MKIIATAALLLAMHTADAQTLKGILKKVTTTDTTKKQSSGLGNILGAGLSNDEIVSGLKQALEVGAQNSGNKLSVLNGFFKNAAIKILLPPEAVKVESTLRNLGFGKQVDDAILSLNRAAEDAAKSAAPIFVNSIKTMSISDALNILKGSDTAATVYLKSKTTTALTEAFRPVIDSSLKKVNATKYWNTLFTTYNKFSLNKINPDLAGYVTEKALSGIFFQVGQEEKEIRKNPLARTTDLLKKVFAK